MKCWGEPGLGMARSKYLAAKSKESAGMQCNHFQIEHSGLVLYLHAFNVEITVTQLLSREADWVAKRRGRGGVSLINSDGSFEKREKVTASCLLVDQTLWLTLRLQVRSQIGNYCSV
jgi:hypothetical protein